MNNRTKQLKRNKPRSSAVEYILQGIRQGVRNRAKSWGGKNYDRRAFRAIPKD